MVSITSLEVHADKQRTIIGHDTNNEGVCLVNIRIPVAQQAVLSALKIFLLMAVATLGRFGINGSHIKRVESLIERLDAAFAERRKKLDAAREINDRQRGRRALLVRTVSDYRVALIKRAKRLSPENVIGQAMKAFDLGDLPKKSDSHEWLRLAKEAIGFESSLLEQGMEPGSPSLLELQTASLAVEELLTAVVVADKERLEAIDEVAAVTLEGSQKLRYLAALITLEMGSIQDSKRREILRDYGITFKGDPPIVSGEPGQQTKQGEQAKKGEQTKKAKQDEQTKS